jgi:hypothetical protein
MKDVGVKIGVAALALALLLGLAVAAPNNPNPFDFNPNKYANFKHTTNYKEDVSGEGYVFTYQKMDTNNLSLDEYMHGSGTFDWATLIQERQKTSQPSGAWAGKYDDYYYYIDDTGKVKRRPYGANSDITMTKQNEMTQAPVSFAYGTGWYAQNPIVYNSLLKDYTHAKSYQEATVMDHQLEYARGYKGDIAVTLDCTGPTENSTTKILEAGKGTTTMKIDEEVTQGTVHVGELQGQPPWKDTVGINAASTDTLLMKYSPYKDPLVEIDANYIGNFKIQKEMSTVISKAPKKSYLDWLPCCPGDFFDIDDWRSPQDPIPYGAGRASLRGIFDCTCRESGINTYKPAWNTTKEQFPNAQYMYKP